MKRREAEQSNCFISKHDHRLCQGVRGDTVLSFDTWAETILAFQPLNVNVINVVSSWLTDLSLFFVSHDCSRFQNLDKVNSFIFLEIIL